VRGRPLNNWDAFGRPGRPGASPQIPSPGRPHPQSGETHNGHKRTESGARQSHANGIRKGLQNTRRWGIKSWRRRSHCSQRNALRKKGVYDADELSRAVAQGLKIVGIVARPMSIPARATHPHSTPRAIKRWASCPNLIRIMTKCRSQGRVPAPIICGFIDVATVAYLDNHPAANTKVPSDLQAINQYISM
jgi:hypothetical protein